MQQQESSMNPQLHAQGIAQMLREVQSTCRSNNERVNDPKAQALFETIAEVLGGAIKALHDYSSGSERVWQSSPQSQPSTSHQQSTQSKTAPPSVTEFAVDVDSAEPPPRLTTEMPE